MSDDKNIEKDQGPAAETSRQPIFLLPAPVTVLCGIMVAVHLAMSLVLNDQAANEIATLLGFNPFRMTPDGAVDGGWIPTLWTVFSHAFLHANWEHLLFNVAWLAVFGSPVANRYGAGRFLALFLITVFAGAVAFALGTGFGNQWLIGASGGVAGLTGAAVRFMFQPLVVAEDPETHERRVVGRHLASIGDVLRDPRARFFSLMWIVLNAAVPLLPLIAGMDVQIAWQAHLGGFFAGFFLVPLFERRQV